MLPRSRRAVLVAALAISMLLPVAGVPLAQAAPDPGYRVSSADIEGQVEQAGEAVDAANAKVAKALKTLVLARGQLPAARKAKADAERSAVLALADAEGAANAARMANIAVITSQVQQQRVRTELQAISDQIDDVVRLVYQQGPLGEIEVILDAQDPGDFASRLASVDAISQSQATAQSDLFKARADLVMKGVKHETLKATAEKAKLAAEVLLANARQAQAQARAAQVHIVQLVAERKASLAIAKKNKAVIAKRFHRLKAKQALMARQAAAAARRETARLAAQGDNSPTGDLRWPIEGGEVNASVGPRVHPVYGYDSCHTGTDIRGNTGTPIRAAASGTVANISDGGPYGLATLIAHADGMTTLYAHQSSVSVSEGQHVDAGEVIGAVGTTGWVTGPHLHFEVRLGGTAYDPMGWFGGSKSPVSCQ
ncbi:MAG: M23 family metallopeptidase [Candidatus Nanopelagicales bacterium]|nr:M23 family metallopeptidase [Candidatus Nanopelagicales bacterium]